MQGPTLQHNVPSIFTTQTGSRQTFPTLYAKEGPVLTPQGQGRVLNSAELSFSFPVSSGSQHRENEWEPNEPEYTEPDVNVRLYGRSQTGGMMSHWNHPASPLPKPKLPHMVPMDISLLMSELRAVRNPQPMNISSIVLEGLNAVRNPQPLNTSSVMSEGMNAVHNPQTSQRDQCKHQPTRQFTGTTSSSGSAGYLQHRVGNKQQQAWLKKDVFTRAAPLSGGIGMLMLQKMGWRQGEGLGRKREGLKEPVCVDFNMNRKGLETSGEGKKRPQTKASVAIGITGKHPVSALGEYCTKKKWAAPQYEVCLEDGPVHKKDFMYKVRVNGVDYKPSVSSNNKKTAKVLAATVCLQRLGLIQKNMT